ncbi:MAG: DUF4198 domain-containing protein [Pedobacter sp.]|nr:DUF4198 domain-containing protein [Pedobacter sp.]
MKPVFKSLTLALALTLPVVAEAHRGWILPVATVFSGENPVASFDAGTSNDLFIADHNAMNVEALKIQAPDGTESAPANVAKLRYRSVFDVPLTQKGTWKLYTASSGLNARWEENGQRKMWPPRGTQPTPEGFEKEVPKKADKLEVTQSSRRFETFVTSGKPTTTVFKPTNVGLELVPVTHPNDLFSGEAATFQFIIDGKPAAGTKIEVTQGERRYRNAEESVEYTTDKDGKVSIKWPAAGQYYLEAEYEDTKAPKPATKRVGRYTAVFEVLPQ